MNEQAEAEAAFVPCDMCERPSTWHATGTSVGPRGWYFCEQHYQLLFKIMEIIKKEQSLRVFDAAHSFGSQG